MNRSDVEKLLVEAKRLTHHSHYVIVGSLSILGAVQSPPPDMAMSVDVDLYPRDDPGRASEVADHLGLGTAFEVENGFYADAVSPRLPALAPGWEQRMIPVQFGSGVTGWFLEPNDAAVSKYARSDPRDREWIRSGLNSGILSMPVIESRFRDATMLDEERSVAARSIDDDRAWLQGPTNKPSKRRRSREDDLSR